MRTTRSIGLFAMVMFIATTTVFGQQSDSEPPDSNLPVSERASPERESPDLANSETANSGMANPKQAASEGLEVSDNVVRWEPMLTHLQVTVSVTGKDFAWRQTFDDHQFPEFDPSEHEDLKPGLYKYSLSYISNEIVDQKSALDSLKTERKNLIQQYEKAVEAGDAKAVKRLYWQANEVRNQATAMQEKQRQEQQQMQEPQQGKKAGVGSVVRKQGRIVIDENGVASKYSSKQDQEERLKKSQQERRPGASGLTTEGE